MTPEGSVEVEEIVDYAVVRRWIYWAFAWMVAGPGFGILVSLKFNFPDFLGGVPQLTFGRMRPVHVNGVVFGAFSTLFLGLLYYMVPRLTGIKMQLAPLSRVLPWFWNGGLIAGSASLLLGFNQGLEVAEFPLFVDIVLWACLLLIALQVMVTVARRHEKKLYVSLWYIMAALVWTAMNFVLGNFILPYGVPGVNNAAFHGLYIHYVVGLWVTPAGLSVIYYFLPVSVRNPLYSHKLSLVGFWSLAFLYPFVGTHHYLFSPIADWVETIAIVGSILLIIPVWTVVLNFFGTMAGRWDKLHGSYPARFFILGTVLYLLGCLQGSLEALRSVQQPTHFTDFVIGHAHLTVFGTYVIWAIAGTLYVWPRITGRDYWSKSMLEWGYWLILSGITLMTGVLVLQGLLQGTMWMNGVEFVDSLNAMKPYWMVRTGAGISMDLGMTLLVACLVKTARSGKALAA